MSKLNVISIFAAFLVGLIIGISINTNFITSVDKNNISKNDTSAHSIDKLKSKYVSHVKTYYVKTDLANIRSAPSIDSIVVKTVKKGYKFISEYKYKQWIKLSESKGWIHQSLLTTNYVPPPSDIEIIEISSRVTERNRVWWKYAWKLTLKNNSDTPKNLEATIQFKDRDDFVIEDDKAYDLYLPAGRKKTFTDYTLVTCPNAHNVEKTSVHVEW